MDGLYKNSGATPYDFPRKMHDAALNTLIDLSRLAVERARTAVSVARDLDRERDARDAELRKLREAAELTIQRLENGMEMARRLFITSSIPSRRG